MIRPLETLATALGGAESGGPGEGLWNTDSRSRGQGGREDKNGARREGKWVNGTDVGLMSSPNGLRAKTCPNEAGQKGHIKQEGKMRAGVKPK